MRRKPIRKKLDYLYLRVRSIRTIILMGIALRLAAMTALAKIKPTIPKPTISIKTPMDANMTQPLFYGFWAR
jgi:hypothetical protein